MRPITPREIALLQELSVEFARLSDNVNTLLDKVLDKQLRADDPQVAAIKQLSEHAMFKAMQKSP